MPGGPELEKGSGIRIILGINGLLYVRYDRPGTGFQDASKPLHKNALQQFGSIE